AITDAMAGMPNRIEVQIFATDIKREYLNFAGRGEFGAESLESVPERLRNKYFKPIHQTDRYAIDPAVRKSIVFAPHDVLSDPPFTRLDLISCRNLLIYFSVEGQQKVLNSFAFGLKERGILFLGSSETVGAHREAFDFIDARNRIFRRTTSKRTLPSTMRDRGREARETIDQNTAIARLSVRTREAALIPAYASLLADYAPPGLLISEQRELLHSFGDARRFLRPPAGVAHLDSTEMVDSAIRTPILAGLERALRQKQPVTFNRIELAEFPAAGTIVDVTIRPITISGQQDPHHALIIIDDSRYSATQRETGESGLILDPDGLTAERIDELEAELDRTREALQSTIQEIETTNEELQASNEELMSSNEELQSTNEELSSVNEELYSVNSEYHRQNDELTRLNADFDLLLQSTEIGVIFLDRELCITRYTSLAGTLFALQDADIGRPIGNFRSPFEDLEPEALLQASEVDAQIVEREARDAAGDTWLIRAVAHDHRRVSVLTIINIGRLRNAELAARRTGDMLTAIQSMANAMYFELDAECRYATSTLGLEDYFDSNEDPSAQPLSLDALFLTDQNLLVDAIRAADPGTEVTAVAPLRNPTGDELRFVSFKAKPTEQGSWRVTGVDVDEYVRTQSRNREQQAILEAMMRASKSQLSFVDADERYRYANPAFERQAGRSIDQILGKKVSEVLPSDAYKDAGAYIRAALQGNRQEYLSTHDLDDGSQQTVSNVYEPVLGDGSQVDGFVADSLDISEYLTAAKELSVQDRLLARAAKFSQTPTLLVDTASGIVEYANSKAQMLLGDTPAVRSNFLISRLSPDWGNNRWVDWLDKLPIGGYDLRRDMLIFSSSGQPQTADVSVTVVADAGAKKAKVRVHDDAERVLMLKDLQERSRELAISNRDLETFASIIAHDLRAPLRHINQFTSLLEEALEAGNSHEANEHAAVIQGSIEAMFGMVDGLLQYAKIGQSVAPFTPIALSETLEAVRKRLESDIGKADAVLVIDTDLPDVAGDKALLEELFQNLISNALKYAKPDQPPEIRIAAQSTDDGVAVVVEDNGVGIDSRYAERVFRLFHRLQPEAEADGLGIGLAACRRIAELHNGNVVLDSDYSGGCRFVVTLGGS
ncbi:MAG: CheR family methyltransferase, partial [Pseudomonadota bacterium]